MTQPLSTVAGCLWLIVHSIITVIGVITIAISRSIQFRISLVVDVEFPKFSKPSGRLPNDTADTLPTVNESPGPSNRALFIGRVTGRHITLPIALPGERQLAPALTHSVHGR